MRRLICTLAAVAAVACSAGSDSARTLAPIQVSPPASADVFAGNWRSTTPSLEFIGLTIVSKSSQQGVMGARLTFSGVAWEGSGRIDGDSLRLDMAIPGSSTSTSTWVVRPSGDNTLQLQARPASASALNLTMAREP